MERIYRFFRRQPAGRLIAMGFAGVILLGTLILLLPISVRKDATVTFVDALFTSTSAVCVTGLIAIDTADHFTPFGQGVADSDRRPGRQLSGYRSDSGCREKSRNEGENAGKRSAECGQL